MKTLLYLLVFARIAKSEEIVLCSDLHAGNHTRLCKNTNDYDKSQPSKPWPNPVEQIVTIYDIPELHENLQTIRLFVRLHVKWNDTRILLTGPEGIAGEK